jgi:hypothetical protein
MINKKLNLISVEQFRNEKLSPFERETVITFNHRRRRGKSVHSGLDSIPNLRLWPMLIVAGLNDEHEHVDEKALRKPS